MRKALTILLAVLLLLPGCYFLGRVFIADSFIVRGQSMEPTLHEGRRIFVNKLAMGARIYTSFDFDSPELKCFRMPGFRPLRPGDIAVFNYPYGREKGKIGFKINYVYSKRCIGCPGDTLSICAGRFRNSSLPGVPLGCLPSQELLGETPDSMLLAQGVVLNAYRHKQSGWTIKEFGPLAVPRKGMTMQLDSTGVALYSRIVEYESGGKATTGPYTFKEDYYFFAGDNVLDSRDSRYFGFVPERFIIGKVACHK